jgi:hypothetical protein
MRINNYYMALAVSACIAAALFLGNRPIGRGADRAAQAAPARMASIAHVAGGLSAPELSSEVAARRQAIEDVLPLLRSLQARGDTVRLARVARSVLRVWAELDSLDPAAVPNEDLRRRIESWAGAQFTVRQPEPADESER